MQNTLAAGFFCCPMVGIIKSVLPEPNPDNQKISHDLTRRIRDGAKSPPDLVAWKSKHWIKSILEIMDDNLDQPTRTRILNLCGRSCFEREFGVRDDQKPTSADAQRYLKGLTSKGFRVERNPRTIVIYYGWAGKQNPMGLSLKEGYCMCPIFESEHKTVSPTFCSCSAGYVKEILERGTGWAATSAEVVKSLKKGDQDCQFKITLANP